LNKCPQLFVMKQLNYIFIVQGEGRGHMTQAICTYKILEKAGHKVNCVIIGINPHREIPDFVKQQINTEIIPVECPGFVMDSKLKSVRLVSSVIKNVLKIRDFKKSLSYIHRKVKEHNPDIIINFYNPLAGLYHFLYRPKIPMICIAHQYIYLHPDYEFPEGKAMDKSAIKFYTRLTALKASKKLALSFYPIKDDKKLSIVGFPPLLRSEVFEQEVIQRESLLVYLVNYGYIEDIINWHKKNPDVELHCFTDKKKLEGNYSDKLHFHQLDDKKFLQMMAQCKGLVSTAGFESVCEAKYMGKPVLMVPVQGNYEQYCNAHDACKTQTGISDTTFNIARFLDYLPSHHQNHKAFKQWVNSAEEKLLEQLSSI
jgi:uncharacterized protein (TIGR00661 family)